MVQDRICAFCYRQNQFLIIVTKLHIVKLIGSGMVYHPITNSFLSQVIEYKAIKPVSWLVQNINAWLIDEHGLNRVNQLKVLGMIREY